MNAKQQTTSFLDAIYSVCDRIDFAICFHKEGDEDGVWLHPDNPAGAFLAGCDRSKAESLRAQLWAKNQARNASIFYRPVEGSPLVLLDDTSPSDSEKISRKYSTLSVVTSPNKCQCWVRADKGLSFEERHQIQTVILHRFTGRADGGARTGKQLGRVAGFFNRKGKYASNPPLVELMGIPFASSGLLNSAEMIKAFAEIEPVAPPFEGAVVSNKTSMFCNPSGFKALPSDRPRTSGDDESKKEFSFALYSLRHGVSPEALVENIRARAEARGRHKGQQALRYARGTVQKALSKL